MRHSFFAAVIGVFVCSISLSGQQTASPPTLLYLQRSLSQLQGNASISDVTLTGSVRRIAGSDDESGSATLKSVSSGVARADLSLSSGTVSETYDSSPKGPAGTWSGPDGHSHSIPQSSRRDCLVISYVRDIAATRGRLPLRVFQGLDHVMRPYQPIWRIRSRMSPL